MAAGPHRMARIPDRRCSVLPATWFAHRTTDVNVRLASGKVCSALLGPWCRAGRSRLPVIVRTVIERSPNALGCSGRRDSKIVDAELAVTGRSYSRSTPATLMRIGYRQQRNKSFGRSRSDRCGLAPLLRFGTRPVISGAVLGPYRRGRCASAVGLWRSRYRVLSGRAVALGNLVSDAGPQPDASGQRLMRRWSDPTRRRRLDDATDQRRARQSSAARASTMPAGRKVSSGVSSASVRSARLSATSMGSSCSPSTIGARVAWVSVALVSPSSM